MPELPEIVCRAREMNQALVGRRIELIEVLQPKCLNVPAEAFEKGLSGAEIVGVTHRGKWLFVETTQGHLLINMGMGGELLLLPSSAPPEKWRVKLGFAEDEADERSMALFANFWWFGNTHYVQPGGLADHAMTAKLGPNALDLSADEFAELLSGKRGRIKSFLLDQSKIAGIGNAYIHDILFRAKLHPLRAIFAMSDADVARLHEAIRVELQRSIDKGAAAYELSLHGERGGFGAEDLIIGYREGKPCPECGTTIEKIKTGSTAGFICPVCQPAS
ncbi:Fpg/Nei family DNA glycosylase [Candidatus Bipolaricaulota bacterium]|nr:Fpg/Nei family DNA glycosylase [Candidatus Bipolaricaulota bacterium]